MYVVNSSQLAKLRSHHNAPPEAPTRSDQEAQPGVDGETIVLIERRQLFRECIAASFDKLSTYATLPFGTVEEWLASGRGRDAPIVIISAGGRGRTEVLADFDTLEKAGNKSRVIVIAQAEGLEAVLEVLSRGGRAYIPTSMSIEVAIQAVKFVQGGGTYVPPSLLVAAQQPPAVPDEVCIGGAVFTLRQAAVIEALRSGKANKIIAYELSMRESTVKVHVRNIMRKLRARNRTEVAILANASAQTRKAAASGWPAHQDM